MPLARNRDKNMRETGLKMSKKKAVQFKKSIKQKNHVDVGMVEAFVEEMDTSESVPQPPKEKTQMNTKKRLLRKQRKQEMREFIKKKASKSKATNPDNMDEQSASNPEDNASVKPTPKVNEKRMRKDELPLVLHTKSKRAMKVNKKELASKGVTTAKRMSKKKARKLLKVQKRNEKEKNEDGSVDMQACAKLASIFSVVYVTVPSKEVGKSIARELIKSRVAACVNIVPQVTSIYKWDGDVQEEEEALLIIKTQTDKLDNLKDTVIKHHPYDVPEFISIPVEYGHEPYLNWLREQVQPEGNQK